ncbi:uncharacterized protein ColSpa_05035 [Colletotrichum spaethianum]|uniref:Uncharacterized protein n=1 Tax=Colletotrichum spaethianum TaxID=700344 RepID=A0AA37P7N6_9PEZI|nr:uncharacterized protein ColSpa_05035 [Colletotrichum spaethianum]GKT44854.1 hypothetical protein ColSpa_05035 [Colletotrichum spaethianum]
MQKGPSGAAGLGVYKVGSGFKVSNNARATKSHTSNNFDVKILIVFLVSTQNKRYAITNASIMSKRATGWFEREPIQSKTLVLSNVTPANTPLCLSLERSTSSHGTCHRILTSSNKMLADLQQKRIRRNL